MKKAVIALSSMSKGIKISLRSSIIRPRSVEIEFYNEDGEIKTEKFDGEMSRLVQKNIDILNGIPIIHWKRSFGYIKCTDSSFTIVSDLIDFYKSRIYEELTKDSDLLYQNSLSIMNLQNLLKERSAQVKDLHFSTQMLIDFEKAIRKELRNRL